ncbi:MAG: cytochrome c1, partial [Sphingomonas sp.]
MVRLIASIVGAAFVLVLGIALFGSIQGVRNDPVAPTAESVAHKHPKELELASNGVFGKFDRRQLQRGFQVYKEVCSACHSLRLVSFRDLTKIGYTDPEVKAIANQWVIEQPSINPETGEPATRKNIPSDHFPSPFANEIAARAANNNALPPDLSLITKAREDGTAYVHSLLTGYTTQPAALLKEFPDIKTPTGLHYNPYFANLNIA